MRLTRTALATVVATALSVWTLHGAERSITYSEIVVAGAGFTSAQGINAGGDIVGTYRDVGNRWHGFLWSRGGVTTIDYPGAAGTDARGIGPGGDIVGTYWMPGEAGVAAHGYIRRRDGTFTPIDYPGHLNDILQRILPDGTILGCRHDGDTMATMRGVVIGKDGAEEIDAYASMHNGATPGLGLIVGLYMNTTMTSHRQEGYTLEGEQFTPFVVPGSNFTAAWDVNPRGEIVGVYRDAVGFHGFVRNGDVYVSVDVPGATATRAFGINAGGDVVGSWFSGGVTRAFVASRTRGHAR